MAVRETLALRVLARDAWGQDVRRYGRPGPAPTPPWRPWTSRHRGGPRARLGHDHRRLGRHRRRVRLTVCRGRSRCARATGGAESAGRRRLEAGVDACYGALRSKDVGRVSALYRPATKADRETLKRLARILGRDARWRWAPRADRERQIGADDATTDFSAPLSWTSLVRRAAGQRAGVPRRVRARAPRLGHVELPHRGISQALSRRSAHPHSAASSPEFVPYSSGAAIHPAHASSRRRRHSVIVCRTLGPLEVTVDGAPAPPELLWRKHLALLVYLARSPRHTRSREHLIGLLWGDRAEAAARHSLSEALRVIRRHAGQSAVEVTVGQVGLASGAVELDVDRLELLAVRGRLARARRRSSRASFSRASQCPTPRRSRTGLPRSGRRGAGAGSRSWCGCAEVSPASGRAQEAAEWRPARWRSIRPRSRRLAQRAQGPRARRRPRRRARAVRPVPRPAWRRLGSSRARRPGCWSSACGASGASAREVQAQSADDAAAIRPPLGGRADELARLLEGAARSARAGRAALLLLEGEPGIGKSRLLGEMLALLRLDGMSVVSARAVEGDRAESVERRARAAPRRVARRARAQRRRRRRRWRRSPAVSAGVGGPVSRRGVAATRRRSGGRWRRRCAR